MLTFQNRFGKRDTAVVREVQYWGTFVTEYLYQGEDASNYKPPPPDWVYRIHLQDWERDTQAYEWELL